MRQTFATYLLSLSLPALLAIACSSGDDATDEAGDGDGDTQTLGDGDGDSHATASGATMGDGDDTSSGGGPDSSMGGAAASTGGGDDGSGGSDDATGGTGGSDTASGGSDTGTGGSAPKPDAIATATITGLNGNSISGTATFTQIDGMVTLEIELQNCPTAGNENPHGTHLHQANDCGNNGNNAGGHWSSGENIGNIECTNSTATHKVSHPTSVWTIGGSANTDVTQHALMIHSGPTGARIGCGVIQLSEK